MFRRFLARIHRLLGVLLSVLFLMWFLSGFVMIYHSYPKTNQQDRLQRQLALSGSLPLVADLVNSLPDGANIQKLAIETPLDRAVFELSGADYSTQLYADTFQPIDDVTPRYIDKVRLLWNSEAIAKIDTLWEPDQWLMPGRIAKDVPVYKYSFADDAAHQLYISSQSGKVLQYTDSNQRFWAWLGAIPHWVYFTSLRQHHTLWIESVKWTSGIGTVMCLLGLILAIRLLLKSTKRNFKSPYKKKWYHWHYILGLVFGLVTTTFVFSGFMSLADLPNWLKKTPTTKPLVETNRRGDHRSTLNLSSYALDYRTLVEAIPNVKRIEWATYQNHPYYKAYKEGETLLIDATYRDEIVPFVLTPEMIDVNITAAYGDIPYTIELIHEHDDQYFSVKKGKAPLPVYRIILEDELHTRFYYNPKTLSQQRLDDNSRLKRFLYGGLHSFNLNFLSDKPILWNILMYTFMIGGTLLSLTGVVLSYRYLSRKLRRIFRTYNIKDK